jgi:gluconate:H+ symporter, GntP family
MAPAVQVLAAEQPLSDAGSGQLIVAALLGIATVVVLIVWAKFHPFIALILGTVVIAAVALVSPLDAVTSFTEGLGSTFGSVGLLIALGAMLGKLLADSGGANEIVDGIVEKVGPKRLPWAMALIAAIIGLPMFFEIGVVILVPIVVLVAMRTGVSLMKVGIPALAGLSILHGLVPPHPGPVTAIDLLGADLGRTLIFGLIAAVPTVIIAGPLFGIFISKRVPLEAPALVTAGAREPQAVTPAGRPATGGGGVDDPRDTDALDPADRDVETPRRRPALVPTVLTVLLPVILMLLRAIGELTLDEESGVRTFLDIIGTPVVAMLAGVIVAMFTLGTAVGFGREKISATLGGSLPGIAGILLIVAAGGGLKQVLIDAGVGDLVGQWAEGANLSPLILGWLVAVGIRLATGSATVATITAAGIVSPLAAGLDGSTVALLALAIGAGSLFFSHVNDAGFWLVKEYFGMTVGQTIKSWSVMETLISVVGLLAVLLLSVIV